MNHKNIRTMMEWWNMDLKLQMIVTYANWWLWTNYQQVLTCTEIDRSKYEQLYFFGQGTSNYKTGVHMFNRGYDARALSPVEINHELCEHINEKFPYDPSRPQMKTVIFHDGTAMHLHFQTMYSPMPKREIG